jgi:hypothetical protein
MDDTTQITRTAYHEAGHIVFAYYYGYTCDGVVVSFTGDGVSKLNYGDDLHSIRGVTNFVKHNNYFSDLSIEKRQRCALVAVPITSILVAGSIAEYYYANSLDHLGNLTLEISGPDLERVDQVDNFLSTFYREKHPKSFIQDVMTHTSVMTTKTKEVWDTIDGLAKLILSTDSKSLDKPAIEASLQQSGFFEFCRKEIE